MGEITTEKGGCDDEIKDTVQRKYLGQVQSCHEVALKSNPNLSGPIVMDAEIDENTIPDNQKKQLIA